MNHKESIIIIGTVLLITLIFLATTLEIRDVPDIDWKSRNHFDKKEPHDLYVFKELLDEKYGEENIEIIAKDSLLDSTTTDQLYITYGTRTAFTDDKLASLESYMRNGNQVLMIGTDFDFYIDLSERSDNTIQYRNEDEPYEDEANNEDADTLDNDDDEYNNDEDYEDNHDDNYFDLSGKTTSFLDTIFQFDFVQFDTAQNRYNFICVNRDMDNTQFQKFRVFDDFDPLQPISFAYHPGKEYGNPYYYFGKIYTGNGFIHAHTAPALFQNLGSRQSYYLDHFNNVFSRFDASKVILEVVDPYTNLVSGGSGNGGIPDRKSPISYIINTPPLAWAYYLLALTLLLYAFFKGKRRQKIIPVVAENKNTSLDYVKTLSILYQNQKQNSKLVKHIREGFYHRIKNKYFIDQKDEAFVDKLSAKSRVEPEEINKLIHKLNSTNGSEFTDDQLIILHKQLESFYNKAE